MIIEEARTLVTQTIERVSQIPVFVPDNMAVHIYYGPHETAQDLGDFSNFRRLLGSTDIFIPELFGWSETLRERMNQASRGDRNVYLADAAAYEKSGDAFFRKSLEAIFSRYVAVDFIDVGRKDHIFPALQMLSPLDGYEFKTRERPPTELRGGEFVDYTIATKLEDLHDFTLSDICRTVIMLSCFGPKTRHIISISKRLREQARIKSFMTMGALHDTVINGGLIQAAKDPSQVTYSYAEERPVFDEHGKIYESGVNGLPLTEAQERLLCLRGIFSELNATVLYNQEPFANTWKRLTRPQRANITYAISAALSYEELFDYMNPAESNAARKKQVAKLVVNLAHHFIDNAPTNELGEAT